MAGFPVSLFRQFSMKSFLQGCLLIGAFYLACFLFVFFSATSTVKSLEERLVSQTIIIEASPLSSPNTHNENGNPPAVQKKEPPAHDASPPHDAEHASNSPKGAHTNKPSDQILQKEGHDDISPLPPAPIPGLQEETKFGYLPVIRKYDNLNSFQAYARPCPACKTQPHLSIAILDFGLSEQISSQILALPGAVTPILSPYSEHHQDWVDKARADGHEVWLDIPIETEEFPTRDPGPRAVRSTKLLDVNEDALMWALSQASGYSGVSLYHDHRFHESSLMLGELLRILFRRGLGYLDTNIAPPSLAKQIAEELEAPYSFANFEAYDAPSEVHLKQVLELLEGNALNGEHAVLVVQPVPSVLAFLQDWIKTLGSKNIVLAPLSVSTGADLSHKTKFEEILHKLENHDTHAPAPHH